MMATRFQLHCQTWGKTEGCGSDLCPSAMHKVFYRGDIPCDILFIGEAPGKSEDKLGQPFVRGAPAGGLLQRIVNQSVPKNYKVGFTNVVACIPRVPGEEKLEPEFEQITSCKPRLEEIIDIASPRLIIAVGRNAKDALEQGYLHSTRIPEGTMVAHVVHPAWIFRQSTAFQGVEIQRVCCTIRDAIHDLENPPPSNTQSSNSGMIASWDDDNPPF